MKIQFHKYCWVYVTLFLSLNLIGAEESSLKEYRITGSKGPTGVVPAKSKEASPAVVGMTLLPGDHLVTGNKGRIELATKEGSVLELREKSSLQVEKVAEHQNIFALKIGKLLARFAPAPKKKMGFYMIRTPTCLGAVRGTELALSVDENGAVQGGVFEGEVSFDSAKSLEEIEEMEEMEGKKDSKDKEETGELDETEKMEEPTQVAESPRPAVPEISSETIPAQIEMSSAPLVGFSTESVHEEAFIVGPNGGIIVEPGQKPKKIEGIPPLVVGELVWFKSLRERIPELRSQWKEMDMPSKMKMRQEALRDRVKWDVPSKYLMELVPPSKRIPPFQKPEKTGPEKLNIPKPQ